MAEADHSHSLLLEFDSHDPEFSRGFEAGRVWALLGTCPDDEICEVVHTANAEMLIRMGESLGRPVRSTELDETWMEIRFDASEECVDA
ncbi:MAG: hypothetical protein WBF71_05055 [Microthrixaceae bacterium]